MNTPEPNPVFNFSSKPSPQNLQAILDGLEQFECDDNFQDYLRLGEPFKLRWILTDWYRWVDTIVRASLAGIPHSEVGQSVTLIRCQFAVIVEFLTWIDEVTDEPATD